VNAEAGGFDTLLSGPWVAWWRRPIRHKISEHLTLNRMMCNEVQLKLSQLYSPLSNIASCIGLCSTALSEYEVTIEIF
jgi:hypothetical protein